jgi:GH25 family lysozyme M1 (1,4-beta-N-acetylmuramidase)
MTIADLSKWQGDIDFGKLKSQVDFVILRVQAGYTTHDQKYKEYVAGCKANGIPFGTYAYFKGVSVPDSIAEAKCAMELTDPESKFFALDIEEKTTLDLVNSGQAFIDYLKNKGVQKVGLYSGENFFKNNNLGAIKCDFVWIARYGTNDGQQHDAPTIPCDLWQYTSVGKLDGINGNVDLNVLTGTKPLEYFTGVAPLVVPEPVHVAAAPVQPKPAPVAPAAIVPYPGHLIRKGSRGKDVERIQRALGIKADGIFGPQTEKSLKAYQARHGLTVDGICGPASWNTMF